MLPVALQIIYDILIILDVYTDRFCLTVTIPVDFCRYIDRYICLTGLCCEHTAFLIFRSHDPG